MDPLVSIVCITYNHEKYIESALEGFLSQKTEFPFEIIIHDDASTDGTVDILRKYESLYPDTIHVIYEKENQYQQGNSFRNKIAAMCRGKYIADCEGDDFWIDNHKLQIQVDFMEQNPEYSMTAHNAIIYDCRRNDILINNAYPNTGEISPEDIILPKGWQLATASLVFRKEDYEMPPLFCGRGFSDVPRHLYQITVGKVYYFDRIMSVYRYFSEGSWTQINNHARTNLKHLAEYNLFLEDYDEYTKYKYHIYICQKMNINIGRAKNLYINKSEAFCQDCDLLKHDSKRYNHILDVIQDSYMQTYELGFLSKKVSEYVESHDRIYIYGAGKYAGILYYQLKKNHKQVQGFIVTQKDRNEYINLPIISIKEFASDSKSGILIGIDPGRYLSEIVAILKSRNILDYMCPFGVI